MALSQGTRGSCFLFRPQAERATCSRIPPSIVEELTFEPHFNTGSQYLPPPSCKPHLGLYNFFLVHRTTISFFLTRLGRKTTTKEAQSPSLQIAPNQLLKASRDRRKRKHFLLAIWKEAKSSNCQPPRLPSSASHQWCTQTARALPWPGSASPPGATPSLRSAPPGPRAPAAVCEACAGAGSSDTWRFQWLGGTCSNRGQVGCRSLQSLDTNRLLVWLMHPHPYAQ